MGYYLYSDTLSWLWMNDSEWHLKLVTIQYVQKSQIPHPTWCSLEIFVSEVLATCKGLAFWDNWNGFSLKQPSPHSFSLSRDRVTEFAGPSFICHMCSCIFLEWTNSHFNVWIWLNMMCSCHPQEKHWDILRHWSTNHKLDCILDSFVKLISVLFCNTLHWHNTVTHSKSNLYFSLGLLLSQASLICVPGKITSHLILETSLGEFHSDVREVQWSSLV